MGKNMSHITPCDVLGKCALDELNDGVFILTADGIFDYINPALTEMTGYTMEDLEGRHFSFMIHTDDLDGLTESMHRTLDGHLEPYEFHIMVKDGTFTPVRTLSNYITRVKKLVGIVTDRSDVEKERRTLLSTQDEYAQKLERTNTYLEAILSTPRELICRFLPDTTLTYVNRAYCEAFGKSRQWLLGKKFIELTPLEEHEDILNIVSATVESRHPHTYTHRAYASDGTILHTEWTDYPIVDNDGNVIEFQAIGRDVSDKIQAQAHIAALIKASLTENEYRIFTLRMRGYSPMEISRQCDITPNTVFTYMKRARKKLNIRTTEDISETLHTLDIVDLL